MNLIPLIFVFTWISMANFLKKTGLELELLTDIDMLPMVKKELGAEYVMQCIYMQKQIINIWKITINALNKYFLCI